MAECSNVISWRTGSVYKDIGGVFSLIPSFLMTFTYRYSFVWKIDLIVRGPEARLLIILFS